MFRLFCYEGGNLNIRYSPDNPRKIYVEGRLTQNEKEAKKALLFSPLYVVGSIIMFLKYPARKRKHGF